MMISRETTAWFTIKPFPHDKILDQTKLNAFADDKLNGTKMKISVFGTVENNVGKGEIACASNFSFSHNVFTRLLSQTRQKVALCVEMGYIQNFQFITESYFRHLLFGLRGIRKVEIRHTNFHFSSKKVTPKGWKVEVFDVTTVKKTFHFSTSRLPRKVEIRKH